MLRTRRRGFHQDQRANGPSQTGRIDGCSLLFLNEHCSCKPEAIHRWAMSYMMHAGLLERARRGVYRLTGEGKDLLSRSPPRIDNKLLEEYPDFVQWRQRSKSPSSITDEVNKKRDAVIETPEETLSRVTDELNNALKVDVLDRVRNAGPSFLERVVVGLLIRMGYGGGDPENGRVTGGSGDGGIDGTIREDALGLDEVYVQAKKYADGNTVGEAELRNFAGAIDAAGTPRVYSSPHPLSRSRQWSMSAAAPSGSS